MTAVGGAYRLALSCILRVTSLCGASGAYGPARSLRSPSPWPHPFRRGSGPGLCNYFTPAPSMTSRPFRPSAPVRSTNPPTSCARSETKRATSSAVKAAPNAYINISSNEVA